MHLSDSDFTEELGMNVSRLTPRHTNRYKVEDTGCLELHRTKNVPKGPEYLLPETLARATSQAYSSTGARIINLRIRGARYIAGGWRAPLDMLIKLRVVAASLSRHMAA